jgi:outer membrane biosynthesis protein TonB
MSAPVLNKVSGPQSDRTAAERSQPPQLPGPQLGGLMLGAALLASFLIHGALLGTVLVASPRPNPLEHIESVTVDLVPETAAEPEQPPPPEKPQPAPEKKPPPRLEIPDFSQMLAAQQAIQSPPQPVPARPPSPAPKQKPASPSSSAPPQGQPQGQPPEPSEQQPDAGPAPVTETSPQDALAAAARIADLMHLPELTSLGVFDGAPSDTKAKLSAAEIAAFRDELRKCWTAPSEVPAGQKPRAVIRIALKKDGNFDAQPQLLKITAPLHGPPVVRNAMEALAKCQPYRSLPAARYAEWKLLDLEFTAQDVAGVNAIADPKAPPKQ